MARYEHLPIYKQALDVAVHFERLVMGFGHYHKYTLGTELRNKSREVMALVVKANAARDKTPELLLLRDKLEELILLMRLAPGSRYFCESFYWHPCPTSGKNYVTAYACGGPSRPASFVGYPTRGIQHLSRNDSTRCRESLHFHYAKNAS